MAEVEKKKKTKKTEEPIDAVADPAAAEEPKKKKKIEHESEPLKEETYTLGAHSSPDGLANNIFKANQPSSGRAEDKKKAELVFNHVKSKEYAESIAKFITLLAKNKGSLNVHVHVANDSDKDSDAKAIEITHRLNEFLASLN